MEVSSGSQTMTQTWDSDPPYVPSERRTLLSFPGSGRVLGTHANPHGPASGSERVEEVSVQAAPVQTPPVQAPVQASSVQTAPAQATNAVTVVGNYEATNPSRGETNEDDGQLRREAARYLAQVPPTLRIRPGTTVQTLQQLYEGEASARQPKANAGPSGTAVSRSETDAALDILALNLVTRSVTRLRSVSALRQHFRPGHHNHVSHVYIIAEQPLPAQAVGLLGVELDLSADFWALQRYGQEEEPEISRPSNVLKRRSVRVRLPDGRLASVALGAGPYRDSTVFLLPRYRLQEDVVRDLVYSGFSVGNAQGSSTITTTTNLGQDPVDSLDVLLTEASAVLATGEPGDPLPMSRILFRLAIAEWASTLKHADRGSASSPDQQHGELGQAGALPTSIDSLTQALKEAYVITESASAEEAQQDVLMLDLLYLRQWATRLLARRHRHNNHPHTPRPDPAQRWPVGASPPPPPPPTGTDLPPQKPGSLYGGEGDMTAGDGSEGGPPSGGGGGGSGHDAHQRHMQRKVDQIAYATIILLSMSFMTSVYGMNLDIFTGPNGGLVSVNKFLATALPFTVGLFVVTFFPDFFDHRLTRNLRVEPV